MREQGLPLHILSAGQDPGTRSLTIGLQVWIAAFDVATLLIRTAPIARLRFEASDFLRSFASALPPPERRYSAPAQARSRYARLKTHVPELPEA